ncbi:hypothetical protein PAXRUDRAFT_17698 [Paxillus rubicundulus Ve08.2h10]|uniref:Uncharacterized protein n=1 Tax=Paxillus rubicundulus Ve08.2h10 TaxID=930991 RepID=A0A0D0CPB2_9AGAM|nr:hypothetical protein PAXRUDRAFT_17698 [Paxillus rubicundulus Ve08.2h10]
MFFQKPVPVDGAHDAPPKVLNKSGLAENIAIGHFWAIGFMPAEKAEKAILVILWKNIGYIIHLVDVRAKSSNTDPSHVSSFSAQFTPILHIYITSSYQQGQSLKTPIGTPVWEGDLNSFEDDTTWSLKYTEESGVYTITQVD